MGMVNLLTVTLISVPELEMGAGTENKSLRGKPPRFERALSRSMTASAYRRRANEDRQWFPRPQSPTSHPAGLQNWEQISYNHTASTTVAPPRFPPIIPPQDRYQGREVKR